MSLEITWRKPRTETALLTLFLLIHAERETKTEREREGDRKKERRGGVRGGWGASKKVWTPAPLWPVKITLWAFRVSEDEGGRGISSFSARQGTAHAWLTLWIPAEPIYMLFLLSLYLILKVCQSQSLCLFQISLTSVCVRVSVRLNLCVWTGNLQAFIFFLIRPLFSIIPEPYTAESLWEMQRFCPMCFVLHAAPEV